MSSQHFDDHLFDIHSFPKRQYHKFKSLKETNKSIKYQTKVNPQEDLGTRSQKDIKLILKLAELPLKLQVTTFSLSEKIGDCPETIEKVQANTQNSLLHVDQYEDVMEDNRTNAILNESKNKTNTEDGSPIQITGGALSPEKIKCPKCMYSTDRDKFILRRHMHVYHTKSFYSCNICQFRSTRRKMVLKHFADQHSTVVQLESKESLVQNYSCHCKACNVKFTSRDFEDHLVSFHNFPALKRNFYPNRKTFWTCPTCRKTVTKFDMFQHISEMHLKAHYNCNICDIKIVTIEGLKEHVEQVHSGISSSSTYCQLCDLTIQDNGDLKHLNMVHSDLMIQETSLSQQANDYSKNFLIFNKCKFCQSYTSFYEIEKHLLRSHLNIQYQCKQCSFVDIKSIRTHITAAHKKREIDLIQLRCGLCKIEVDRKNLVGHIGSHENELLEAVYSYNRCNTCPFQTISKISLNKHKVKIHNTAIHDCPVCEIKTKTLQKLVNHVIKDHPDFRYTCDIVGCTTKLKSKHYAALLRHRKEIHETRKLFTCNMCPITYRRNEYLNIHKDNDHNPDGSLKPKSLSVYLSRNRSKRSLNPKCDERIKKFELLTIRRRRLMNRSK